MSDGVYILMVVLVVVLIIITISVDGRSALEKSIDAGIAREKAWWNTNNLMYSIKEWATKHGSAEYVYHFIGPHSDSCSICVLSYNDNVGKLLWTNIDSYREYKHAQYTHFNVKLDGKSYVVKQFKATERDLLRQIQSKRY